MDIERIVKIIKELVYLPRASVVGVLKGDKLLVVSTKEKDVSLWTLDLKTKKMERLTKEFISDVAIPPYYSEVVYFTRDVEKGREKHKIFRVNINKPMEEEEIDMEPMRINSVVHKEKVVFVGSTEQKTSLYIYDKEVRELLSLPTFFYVSDYYSGLIVGGGPLKGNPRSMEILIAKESGEYEIFTPKEGSVNKPFLIYKGKIIFESNFEGEVRLYEMDPESKEIRKLELEDVERYEPTEYVFVNEGPQGELIVIAKREGRSKVFVNGKEVKGPLGNYYTAFIHNGKVYASFTNNKTPTSIISLGEKEEFVFKAPVPEWLEKAIKEVRFEKVKSFDGLEIPTFVIVSGETSIPGPGVLLIHGGPWAEDDDRFDIMAYTIAAIGYHVIRPNYRGSTGYGPEFMLKIIGDPCGGELEDIVSVARYYKGKLLSKACIMGYSYGGYMTMCALTRKPEEFECGVAGASVVDWEEMYKLSDALFRSFIEILFGKDLSKLRERSPINYVENLRAPLCIIHPQNDTRTPLKPVLKFMEKALELNKSFEAHIIPDMGHAIRTLDDAVNILLPAAIFLSRMKEKKE